MNKIQIIIFVTIVLGIYSLANIYIFIKGGNAIPLFRSNKLLYGLIFFTLAFTFIAAKFIESRHSSFITDALNIIGGFWLAFLLYGFLFLFVSDILLLITRMTGMISAENVPVFRKWSFIVTITFSGVLILGGFINALIPTVKEYNISINKPLDNGMKSMKIAAVSDIHIGSIIRERSLMKLSQMLDDINPDVVLLLGDIVDGEIGPVIRGDLLKYFKCPECANGLYAITGNHEFIGGADKTIPYIESKGIRILKDEIVILNGGIQLIGRIDKDSRSFYRQERKSLQELMADIDTLKPVIVLDHQPFKLDEPEKYNIDLQLSGHTHNGQMWPLNHITQMVWELSYGYLRKGDTQFIVSSGYGIWGPRVRSGSRPEVLLINISFKEPNVSEN